MQSGRAAGAHTALVRLPERRDRPVECDYVVDNLLELIPIVEYLADGRRDIPCEPAG
jgi:phosphoglycolate phosphatase-like HAD superfamily hydrolase